MAKKRRVKTKATSSARRSVRDADVEGRLVAYAEQLGWMAGSVQARAEGWLDRHALMTSLTRIRDGAADLLAAVATLRKKAVPRASRSSASAARLTDRRSGGKVGAPGKQHRPPPPSHRGVKHSDQRIAKERAADEVRRRRGRRG